MPFGLILFPFLFVLLYINNTFQAVDSQSFLTVFMVNQISRYVKIQQPLKIKKEYSSNFATVKYFDKIDRFLAQFRHRSLFMQSWGGGGRRGRGGKKEGVGVKAISDWLQERGLNIFIKKFWRVSKLIARYIFNRGPLAKMGKAVKQQSANNICETVMLNCTILCQSYCFLFI